MDSLYLTCAHACVWFGMLVLVQSDAYDAWLQKHPSARLEMDISRCVEWMSKTYSLTTTSLMCFGHSAAAALRSCASGHLDPAVSVCAGNWCARKYSSLNLRRFVTCAVCGCTVGAGVCISPKV